MAAVAIEPRFVKVPLLQKLGERQRVPHLAPARKRQPDLIADSKEPKADKDATLNPDEHSTPATKKVNINQSVEALEDSTLTVSSEGPSATSVTKEPSSKKGKGKKKNIKKAAAISSTPEKKDHSAEALSYLRLWHSDVAAWSFKKKLQNWLLENMFNKSKVKKQDFKVLLQYLEGLQGSVRDRIIQKSQALVESYNSDTGNEDCLGGEKEDTKDKLAKRRYKRAVEVLKVLA